MILFQPIVSVYYHSNNEVTVTYKDGTVITYTDELDFAAIAKVLRQQNEKTSQKS